MDTNATLISGSPIERYLKELHARYSALSEGQVADYIPELAKADPGWFGICIATRDGHVYEVGDTRQAFTIQSISKALSYGLALQDRGEDYMLSRVGVEPSGEAFNAISLKPETGAPFNPMINAGAIATCGQILATGGADSNTAHPGLPVFVRRASIGCESAGLPIRKRYRTPQSGYWLDAAQFRHSG